MSQRMNLYGNYLLDKYGATAYRIGVDAGFSCPNRESRHNGGCIYCDGSGSRSAYINVKQSLKEQVDHSLNYLKTRYGAEVFILYFQAYSGTNASVNELKKIYDYGLSLGPFSELIIATRPDCLDEDKINLIDSYTDRGLDVWLELGLQSMHDSTLKRIDRGETLEQFEQAWNLLEKTRIKKTVHLIFGLPGETRDMMMKTVEYTAQHQPEGIKFHNLHIPVHSRLYQEYRMGELSFPSSARHVEYLADAIERLPAKTLIMRVSTDTPEERSGAIPGHFWSKNRTYALLERELQNRGSYQEKLYNPLDF